MKNQLRFLTFFLIIISFVSCNNNRMDCNASYSPYINYVGFDSTDFSEYTFEVYKKCCGFDSLISIDTFHYNSYLKNFIKDTFALPNMYYPSAADYYGIPNYNWKIKLQNNVSIEMSDINFEKTQCPDFKYNEPCFCELSSFRINTINCSKAINNSTVFIHK